MNHEPKLEEQKLKTPANHWLRGFLLLFSFFSLYSLLRHDFSGHFRTFSEAARRLNQDVTPYGSDFGLGVGYYFYSPTSALYFFRGFLPFPEKLGLALYMVLSLATFFWGAWKYLKNQSKNALWLLLLALPQVYASVISAKLELLIMGILFITLTEIQKNPKGKIAPFFLALPIVWKYQPLPIFGLVALASLLFAEWTPVLITLLGVLFWFALPIFEIGLSFYLNILSQMQSSLSAFSAQAYLNFDNLFSSLGTQFSHLGLYYAGAALLSAGYLIFQIKKNRVFWATSVEISFALGSAYITLLSPLQQNNAYILWLPILFSAGTRVNTKSKIQVATFFGLWIWVALGYSDLMPAFIRTPFREHGLKPLFTLAFTLFTLFLIHSQPQGASTHARDRLKS